MNTRASETVLPIAFIELGANRTASPLFNQLVTAMTEKLNRLNNGLAVLLAPSSIKAICSTGFHSWSGMFRCWKSARITSLITRPQCWGVCGGKKCPSAVKVCIKSLIALRSVLIWTIFGVSPLPASSTGVGPMTQQASPPRVETPGISQEVLWEALQEVEQAEANQQRWYCLPTESMGERKKERRVNKKQSKCPLQLLSQS